MFQNFLASGYIFATDEILLKFKLKMFNIVISITAVFTILFSILSFLEIQNIGIIQTAANIILTVTCIVCIVILRVSKTFYTRVSYLFFTLSFLVYLVAFICVQHDEFRMIWFYLLGTSVYVTGSIRSGDIVVASAIISITIANILYDLHLSQMAINSSILGLVVMSLLLRSYSKKIIDFEEEIIDKENFIITELEQRVFFEVEKNREHEQTLIEQSRRVQMGELIAMIAHQWRQPLSSISATSINMQLKIELDKVKLSTQDKEYALKEFDKIDTIIRSMSITIDDFRNFYKSDRIVEVFGLDDIVKKTLAIIEPMISYSNIEIITEFSDTELIEGFENELIQVLLNILKNSYDNFLDQEFLNQYIKITIQNHCIIIQDNGGGIPNDILNKIFDPYFSTKSKKNGTGLGLYMSKIIVEDHHHGKLSAKNQENGVCFVLEFFDKQA